MARLKGTYSAFVATLEEKGVVTTLSHEATVRIDVKISDAFSSAQRTAVVKQQNSVQLMKQRELKRLK